jgi:hypothetical protein
MGPAIHLISIQRARKSFSTPIDVPTGAGNFFGNQDIVRLVCEEVREELRWVWRWFDGFVLLPSMGLRTLEAGSCFECARWDAG